MASRLLDGRTRPALQPATALWHRYQPAQAPYRFTARNADEARAWQARTRAALLAAIGFQDFPVVPPAPEFIERMDRGDYTREKWVIRTTVDSELPFYLLRPTGVTGPLPVLLALHGHGYGVKDIVGLWEDGAERSTPDGYSADFGVALCRAGFAVVAPEISCFGEKQTDYSYLSASLGQPVPSTCAHTAALATHLGGSVAGLRVFEARRLLDYVLTLPDLDARRVGAMGISGGGMHTLFSAAVDPRIKACVISGYFSSFRASLLAMHHCPCNFVHGLGQFGEMHDLLGLIAPRPVLIEAGDHDPIFPIAAVHAGVGQALAIYDVFGAASQLATDYFEGRHRINGRVAYPWLREHVRA